MTGDFIFSSPATIPDPPLWAPVAGWRTGWETTSASTNTTTQSDSDNQKD